MLTMADMTNIAVFLLLNLLHSAFIRVIFASVTVDTRGKFRELQSISSTAENYDGNLRYNEVTFLASHNAHANRDAAKSFMEIFGINQETSIYNQLFVDGVRGLLLDIRLDPNETAEPLRLVHDVLDYGGFFSAMDQNLVPFLEKNEDAVVMLYLQTVADSGDSEDTTRDIILENLRMTFSSLEVNGKSLKDLTFKYNHTLWKNHEDWPTMSELRQSNQRIFVFSDRSEFFDSEYGFFHNEQVMQENDWNDFQGCSARYMWQSPKVSLPSNNVWSRLFMMNHFCCESGAESRGSVVPDVDPLLGGGDNGWGILYPRIKKCMDNNGLVKPNFIALDWVFESKEALIVADYMNFGGILGTGQVCNSDSVCATSSCNIALGLCQCQECSRESQGVCEGCGSGQFCLSPEDASLNQCRNTLNGSIFLSSSLVSSSNQTDIEMKQLSENVSSIAPTETPVTPSSMFCGESYENAKLTCTDETACPGGYECPSGLTCFSGIKCFSRPPTKSPTSEPTTASPTSLPTFAPTTAAPITPSKSPTKKPTRAPFDFSNEKYCGINYTVAKSICYTTTPCPSGSPSVCLDGETCFGGISCNAPPTMTPTTSSPSDAPSAIIQISTSGNLTSDEGPTSAPFKWANPEENSSFMTNFQSYVVSVTGFIFFILSVCELIEV